MDENNDSSSSGGFFLLLLLYFILYCIVVNQSVYTYNTIHGNQICNIKLGNLTANPNVKDKNKHCCKFISNSIICSNG